MGTIKIGYERLNQAEKRVYEQFEKAFSSCAATINGNGFDRNVDVMKVLQVALGDNPHVIYFDTTQVHKFASLFGRTHFHFIGTYSSSQNEAMANELKEALITAINEIEVRNPASDYDTLICIYEYLQDHVAYDDQELAFFRVCGKSKNPQLHNAYGALVKRLAVCDGIAAAFCLIAQSLGYSCMVVGGRAAFRTTDLLEHAWNIIKIDSKYFHLDATWGISQRSGSESIPMSISV